MKRRAPAERIETARLILRAWRAADAPLLKAALEANLEHLSPWIPRAVYEPGPLASIVERLARYEAAFASGEEWLYAILALDERTLIGGCGLYPRVGPGAVEIGYWVQEEHTRRGYATEAAGALVQEAFGALEVERIEIRCDPQNVASMVVPGRLGFRRIAAPAPQPDAAPYASGDTAIWELARADFELRGATGPDSGR